jgi:hypothetical protein
VSAAAHAPADPSAASSKPALAARADALGIEEYLETKYISVPIRRSARTDAD